MTQGLLASVDEAIALLEESDDFRVLRRFRVRDSYAEQAPLAPGQIMPPPLHRGLVLDVETTGKEPDSKVIKLGAVPFMFSHDGHVYDLGETYEGYQDPGIPIPPEIVELTGITDDDVRGKSIDKPVVAKMLLNADLVIAHYASFDRPRVEDLFKTAAEKHWADSYSEVPWESCGIGSGKKLDYLLYRLCGEFHDAHGALQDALVALHLLAAVEIDRRPALAALLNSARQDTVRLWAVGAPFEVKEKLKARNYRWCAPKKCWALDLKPGAVAEEKEWLAGICGVKAPREETFDALDRFSARTAI